MAKYGIVSVTASVNSEVAAIVTFRPSVKTSTVQTALGILRKAVPQVRFTSLLHPNRWLAEWPDPGTAAATTGLAIMALDSRLGIDPNDTAAELAMSVMNDTLTAIHTIWPKSTPS